jgi:hypothetical protein
MYGRKIKARQL